VFHPALGDCRLVLLNGLRVCLFSVHEVGVLPDQFVDGVAGQYNERVIRKTGWDYRAGRRR
jgi:hypothetical protein